MDEDCEWVSSDRHRGVDKTGLAGYVVATAYNLVRMVKLVLHKASAVPGAAAAA